MPICNSLIYKETDFFMSNNNVIFLTIRLISDSINYNIEKGYAMPAQRFMRLFQDLEPRSDRERVYARRDDDDILLNAFVLMVNTACVRKLQALQSAQFLQFFSVLLNRQINIFSINPKILVLCSYSILLVIIFSIT